MLTTPILAAPRRTKYVSDVIVAFGNTYEEAVQWLKSNGWSNYVEADLNKNSSSIFDKDRAVVLGYRTTYNVDEAITDLALMNMEGGYSGRSFDTKYITPFLKQKRFLGAMKESGWLTRSLEQNIPSNGENVRIVYNFTKTSTK